MLLVSLLALVSFQDVPTAPAEPTVALTLTVQSLPKTYKQNPVIKLTFNGRGQVSSCNIAKTSGSAGIDKVACTQAAGNVSEDPVDGKAPAARDVIIAFEVETKG